MPEPHVYLNGLSEAEAARALARCCGAARWVAQMNARRPFASADALQQAALRVWRSLSVDDHLEAFAHHPRIGADRAELERRYGDTAVLSGREQAGVGSASAAVLDALREANLAYEARFGFVFLVCATGKGAEEMLAMLRQRLEHDRGTELAIAAGEQEKITRLRLLGLGSPPAPERDP